MSTSDFILGKDSGFDFVNSQIQQGAAFPFTAKATAPTVTLPRIKALTTGTIPSFLDAILNIAESDTTSSLKYHDNWVYQLKQQNKSIHFYGDDTWIRLFPDLFDRMDGTTSFYVSDTVQVDLNVTRHITDLQDTAWDAAIFHYLGLDHIGHLGGPSSPLMKPKQKEMDAAIEHIYRIVKQQDIQRMQQDANAKHTLIVVCGDHGMNEKGNHGGSSIGETSAALVFLSSTFESLPSKQPPLIDLNREHIYGFPIIDQIDLVPTLASLFAFPVPKNNLGKMIPELYQTKQGKNTKVSKLYTDCLLQGLRSNAFQLGQLLSKMMPEIASVIDHATSVTKESPVYHYSEAIRFHLNYVESKYQEDGKKAMEFYYKVSSYESNAYPLGLGLLILMRFCIAWCHGDLSNKLLSYSNDVQWHLLALTLAGTLMTAIRAVYRFRQKQNIDVNQTANIIQTIIKAAFVLTITINSILVLVYKMRLADIDTIPFMYQGLLNWELVTLLDQVQLGRLIYNYQGASFFVLWGLFYVTKRASLMSLEEPSENKTRETLVLFLYSLTPFLVLLSGIKNAILFLIFHLQFLFLQKWQLTEAIPVWLLSVISVFMSHCGFFLTGHTNSIASVDLSHAYIGVNEYDTLLIGFLTFCSNWSGSLWWAAAGWAMIGEKEDWYHHLVIQSTIFSLVLSCLSISVTVLREHLFIWTVFSPKYLYQTAWTCMFHWFVQVIVGTVLTQCIFKWNVQQSEEEIEEVQD
ncbi:alkaline-phosphatase-like protein [Gilbertella persicaria]|uniref:alkaline-phosphatase-like protein n=1 Tax=Gilbertella persicaria TaxID=101096 RepID=UPI00221ED43A|nr:alkaline-phosphatase-like protein [Gilbertella persicaria]KAI8058701.1 alkaline-phosphatase-like protein [Gilbertella persicaria]